MKKRGAFFITALLPFAGMLHAMDWPAADAKLVRNFGFNDRGRPVLGTVFDGDGPVQAAGSGEVIFSHTGVETASRLPSPLGSWTALDHGNGLISIYSRCGESGGVPDNGVESAVAAVVEQGDPIAVAGVSGWSAEKGFYFVLYDRKERRWVNPSMIIIPFPDTRPPQINAIELRNEKGEAAPRGVSRLSQGRYSILAFVTDTMTDPAESPLAPHRIICSVNGAEAGSLVFETIAARDGALMVNRNGLVPAPRVFASGGAAFEAGEVFLPRGQASIEIIAQDIAGNSRSSLLRLIVE